MKAIIGMLLMLVFAASFSHPPEMRLRGEYAAGEGETLYLNFKNRNLDSVTVKNGKFEFNVKDVQPDEYLITRKGQDGKIEAILIYLDNYDTYVKMEKDTYILFNTKFIANSVTGNPTHQAMNDVNEIILRVPLDEVMQKPELKNKLLEVAQRGDMATAFAMWKYAAVYERLMSRDQLNACIEKVGEPVKATIAGKRFVEAYQSLLNLAAGGVAPDFSMQTPDGKEIKLSEYVKGKKLVLIDFWASWCGPCRARNPEVLKLYNQYRDKGFDVLGVSLDTKVENWKKAIEEDKMPWGQVSDLKGWKSPICDTYNFRGIPALFLVDGNMKMIARNTELHKNLADVLAKYFNQ